MALYKTAERLIEKIDYPALKAQKLSLLETIDALEKEGKKKEADHLTGILGLIDNIQDYAVDVLGNHENIVFNLTED